VKDDGRKGAAFWAVVGLGLIMTPAWPLGLLLVFVAACR
jgi:hypothetical protein